ncbi:hypothetical protein BGZ63DRAFT_370278 [Mariannaea sp. PMI_226]|nr:hypothetical protein BGZ63DRAFT_370278 [Mariannaea sp. PMI_226]
MALWTKKTFTKRTRPAKIAMTQAFSVTPFRALKAYQLTFGNLGVMANNALPPKRLERLVILGNLVNRAPFQSVASTLVTILSPQPKKEKPEELLKELPEVLPEEPLPLPTIILTTPNGDIIHFENIPSGKKCSRPDSIRQMQKDWLKSGLLCPLHAVKEKKVQKRKSKIAYKPLRNGRPFYS